MIQKIHYPILVIFLLLSLLSLNAYSNNLPDRLIVGYWHNWGYPNSILLDEITEDFDVINVSFATPTEPFGATMQFTPNTTIYPDPQNFINDVAYLQENGKNVLISIGGANDPINLDDSTDIQNFVTSMSEIIDTYGFDGVDIDLEGASLYVEPGDSDFRSPTSPLIVNFIEAITQLIELMPDLILTAAPETAYVQGGYSNYGGIWGAYLPVIHALRDTLSYVHVQHYNTGSMYGRDGNIYEPATADFHVAMTDMLLAGFPVDVWGENIYFDPLEQDQVAIGLPACAEAAGSGYTEASIVHNALDYIILGIPFGGQYQLANPDGYWEFRGLMTWSINWDAYDDYQFSSTHREYLDNLEGNTEITCQNSSHLPSNVRLYQNYPNPFNPATTIRFNVSAKLQQAVSLKIYDINGKLVKTLINSPMKAGKYSVVWNGNDNNGIQSASGTYFYKIVTDEYQMTKSMLLLK
jgi:chitinase